MSTLRDVAKIAEVNISTISRYLSGKLKVTPGTEQRILAAIEQTGYEPNLIAQSLRSGSIPTIAAVVPDIFQPGISGIISGVDDRLLDTEHTLTTAMTKGSADREIRVLRNLRHMMVAGVIVVGHPIGERNDVQALRSALGDSIPLVFVSRNFRPSAVAEVCPDQESGALELTQHLIGRGYRAIGIIIGSREHPDAVIKLEGYRRALADAGMEARPGWIEEGYYRPEETRAATQRLLQQGVDAIFCTSDLMAVSAAQYLKEMGCAIPDDTAVAGYGGTLWAEIFSPSLTTVVVRVAHLGRMAVELLLEHIKYPDRPPEHHVRPVYLRVGDTT